MTDADAAGRAWRGMRALVLDHYDRRRAVCDALGMSFVRVKALRRLAIEPSNMGDLASRLGADAPYVTLIVDDLERRGLAERTVHPHDRRARVVTVTDEGRRLAEQAEALLGAVPPAFADLPDADLAVLDRVVARLLAAEPPA